MGAIIASYRAAGYSADQIFQEFMNTKKLFNITALNIFSKKSLLKNTTLQQRFTKDLPQYISDLPKKVYIGATDIHTAKFVLFDKGELVPILLGSIAIPGVFPPIEYKNHMYIDGGTSNNFPVSLAKKAYPKQELIGISLNKFKENQPIKTIVDILSVSFEILLRHDMVHSLPLIDHVFYPDIILKILDTNKKNIQKTYDQGYQDCMKHFK